jgi:cell division septal protein FtsQ
MERKRKRRPEPKETKKELPKREVTYTEPLPINRKNLAIVLVSIVVVAMAAFFGLSIFFRVDKTDCVISGNEKYDAATIWEASGIQDGSNLLSFGKAKAAGKIMQKLPYIKSVRIGITLPSTVKIHVEEIQVVYAAEDTAGKWWLITSEGRVVEQTSDVTAVTVLQGFKLHNPQSGQQAVAKENEPDDEGAVVTFTNAERLNAALSIVTQLERNGILGEVASVNVEKLGAIELWYGDRYQVKLGNTGRIDEKIAAMADAISQMDKHQSGQLDITFADQKDQIYYIPSDL